MHSSLGSARPKNIVVLPVLFEGETKAVIELSALQPFTATHLTFLEQLTQSIGVVLNTIEATMRTENLLQQSQQLTIELQTRQTELQQTNEQLALKAQQLAEQNVEVERKNNEVEQARRALEEKAAELALTSKYKSEFLANMSHELRTPLNSILILGQQLAENPTRQPGVEAGGLRPEHPFGRHRPADAHQRHPRPVEDRVGHGDGRAGGDHVPVAPRQRRADVPLTSPNRRTWRSRSRSTTRCRATFTSDPKRLQQILKNLLSNAFKFTAQGQVKMRVEQVTSGWSAEHPVLRFAPAAIAIEVSDTGIGIAPEKQRLIFEAFQQADAGTSRKYGGTGLGLAISRELATLLGGEIRLVSVPGQGSTFTLYLPLMLHRARARGHRAGAPAGRGRADRARPLPAAAGPRRRASRRVVLDDRDESARATTCCSSSTTIRTTRACCSAWRATRGFKGIVANRGATALTLARQYLPTAITLDVFLPDMLGWTVLNNLKLDPATRHIPVQMLSVEEERQHGLSHGAFSYLVKPGTTEDLEHAFDRIKSYVAPHKKRLLVVEDNDIERAGHRRAAAVTTTSRWRRSPPAPRRSRRLRERPVECCVIDLRLPGHDRVRAARSDAGGRRRCATRRSSSSPARS